MDHENLTSSNDKKVNLCAFTFYQYVKEYMDLFKFLIELHSRYLHIWPCLGNTLICLLINSIKSMVISPKR